jgi:hypothetical protein
VGDLDGGAVDQPELLVDLAAQPLDLLDDGRLVGARLRAIAIDDRGDLAGRPAGQASRRASR